MVTNPEGGWDEGVVCCGHSRRSGIAWCRWRRCWSWSRSSRRTWSRSNTPIGPSVAPWTPLSASQGLLRTRVHRGGGRGLERILRQHSPRRVDEIGVPADQRRLRSGADQDVAGDAGGRDRRARGIAAGRPATRTRGKGARKGLRSHRCCRIIYMRRFVLGWKSRRARAAPATLGSSTTRMTS